MENLPDEVLSNILKMIHISEMVECQKATHQIYFFHFCYIYSAWFYVSWLVSCQVSIFSASHLLPLLLPWFIYTSFFFIIKFRCLFFYGLFLLLYNKSIELMSCVVAIQGICFCFLDLLLVGSSLMREILVYY